MLRFDNPSHRQALIALGFLQSTEHEIAIAEALQRLTNPDQIEAIFYIFKQELAHHLQKYLLVDTTLAMIQDRILAAPPPDYAQLGQEVDHFILEIRQAREQAAEYMQFIRLLHQQAPVLPSSDHLQGILELATKIVAEVHKKQATMEHEVAKIRKLLEG